MSILSQNVVILAKPRGKSADWKPMSGIKVVSIDDAKQQLAKRSEVLNQAFDFAIRVTTIEGYCDDRT